MLTHTHTHTRTRDGRTDTQEPSGRQFTLWSRRPSDESRTCTGIRYCSGCWGRRTSAGWSTPWGGWSRRSSTSCRRCSLLGRCSGSQTICERRAEGAINVLLRGYPHRLYPSVCVRAPVGIVPVASGLVQTVVAPARVV